MEGVPELHVAAAAALCHHDTSSILSYLGPTMHLCRKEAEVVLQQHSGEKSGTSIEVSAENSVLMRVFAT